MATARRVRSTLVLLSVLTLVGNLLAGPFLHSLQAHAALSAQDPASAGSVTIVDPVLGALPICHPGGEPSGADRTAPGGHPGSGGGAGHCPACTLLAKLSLTIALISEPVEFARAPFRPRPAARTHALADHLSLGGIRSRAPPLAA